MSLATRGCARLLDRGHGMRLAALRLMHVGRDRRRGARKRARGSFEIFSNACAAPQVIEDLSGHGALLRGDACVAVGEVVSGALRLGTLHLEAKARVVRRAPAPFGETALAIELLFPAALHRMAIEALLDAIGPAEAALDERRILVIDPDEAGRRWLGRGLRLVGHPTDFATTPLEALVMLTRDSRRYRAVIAAPQLSSCRGEDLLAEVAELSPTSRCVLWSPDSLPPDLAVDAAAGGGQTAMVPGIRGKSAREI